MVGRTISQYIILERLGGGGMGEIYRARDTRLNRIVAIKVLPKTDAADEQRRQRFIQEAQTASGLNHPNIITVHDIIADGGSDLLVMELVSGKTLSELISPTGMPPAEVLSLGIQIASALATAHAAGIVHRDVKPANVMVTPSGLVKVLDFGLAKSTLTGSPNESNETRSIVSPLTIAGTVLGTVNYMSPEQAEGKTIDGRSDVFSLGILLYEMTTGQPAFRGDSMIATMSSILRDEAPAIRHLAPGTPQPIIDIIDRCLRKNPDHRFQSMDELRSALMTLKQQYDSGSVRSMQIPAGVALPKRKSKTSLVAVAGAFAVVAVAGGGWWFSVLQKAPPPQPAPVAQQKPEPVAPPAAQVAVPDPSLTNDSIIEMVTQKVPVPVILDQIRSTKSKFDLSTAEIIRLSKAGVPVNVIQAMRDPSKAPVTAAAKPAAGLPAGLKSAQTNPLPASSSPKDPPVPSTASVPIPAPHQPAPVVAPPPVPTVPSPPAVTVNLVDGLPFGIELAEDVSNEVKAGTTIRFRVPKEVVSEGSVVIPKGTIVTGQVVEESRKKAFVVNVKATYELLKADLAGGQTLRVRATPTAGQSRRPIDSAAKKKPKDVAAPAGTPFVAYVDGAQKVSVRK